MITMRHSLMPAIWAVYMAITIMHRATIIRVCCAHLDNMLVVMIVVRVV